MKKSIKDEWVRRLRSGNYPQGRRELNGRSGYCCLGVLCEVAADQGAAERYSRGVGPVSYGSHGGSYSPFYLSPGLIEWAGLGTDDPSGDPYLTINGFRRRATKHNDGGATFEQIADAIESQIPEEPDDE